MLPNYLEYPAQVNHTRPVKMQHLDSGSSYRRQTNHQQKIFCPDKMVTPTMGAGMKKRHSVSSDSINNFSSRVFVIIAPLASQRQVVQAGLPTFGTRDDMFD